MSLKRLAVVVPFAALLVMVLATSRAQASVEAYAKGPVTNPQIDEALKRGIEFLWSKQKPDGRWEEIATRTSEAHDHHAGNGDTFGGFTSLCVYALLEAGVKPTDPRIERAVQFLKRADAFGAYAIGMRLQVWLRLPQTPEIKQHMQADATRLVKSMIREGAATGLWDYTSGAPSVKPGAAGVIDHSVAQYGVLGLWAAVQGGAQVPPETWRTIEQVWRKHQNENGGWVYQGDASAGGQTPSMTAAGVATLMIVQDIAGQLPPAIGSTLAGEETDAAIEKGLEWLSGNFEEIIKACDNYTLYGIERISTAGGHKYIGKHDWFEIGSRLLVHLQREDGCWNSAGPSGHVADTAFAVLFLVHGRAPVILHKLNYRGMVDGMQREAPWNRRPRDAANLSKFMGANLEAMLNWQVVNLGSPPVEMHEAPVMYLSGSAPIKLSQKEEATLRQYLEDGGLMLVNTETPNAQGNDEFTNSVLAMGRQMFPGRDFRVLPPNHPIYTDQQYRSTRWKTPPVVWGLSNGVREMILIAPTVDLGKAWQAKANTIPSEAPKFELGANILLYAISRQKPSFKGQTYYIKPKVPEATPGSPATMPATKPARTLRVARLTIGTNWDPEPGGWRRVNTLMENDFSTTVVAMPIDPSNGNLLNGKFDVAHLTGTTAFKLTPAQQAELRTFTARGGTLVIDAAGGSAAFADAAEQELAGLFGGKAGSVGEILPITHAVYTLPKHPQAKIADVDYRFFMRQRTTGKLDAPRLRGLIQGNRVLVFFSREDLSAGMTGPPTDGIVGYSAKSATEIMRNILLYAGKP